MSTKYDEYLEQHIANVNKAADWICEHFPEVGEKIEAWKSGGGYIFPSHDKSKFSEEEYKAYDTYFYADPGKEDVKAFNYAWLHHIHNNPHHWQYWVLQHDDEPEEALEMPYEYVVEMICDWWSFSFAKGNLHEIFDWYEAHSDMKLHENTRKLVEEFLERIRLQLNKEAAENI